MSRGSGLYQKLMEKRRELEKAIADIDAVARVVHGGKGGRGRARRVMSEEQKHKISVAATKRHAQARAKAAPKAVHKATHRPKAINRPRPKAPRPRAPRPEQGQAASEMA